MRVVLLGPYPVDERFTRGGVEKVMSNTVLGLAEREDLELHVVAPSYMAGRDHSRVSGRVNLHFVQRQRRFCLPTFNALTIHKTRRAIRRLAPDLVHCQESGIESFIAAGTGLPTIVTVHAIFRNEAKYYPGLAAQLRYRQVGLLAKLAEPRVTRYIASSMYAYNEMKRLEQKVHGVIENPIDQRYFDVPDRQVPGRILFSGTMYPRKGVHDLVAAVAELARRGVSFGLHVTGQVHSPDYFEQVKQAAIAGGIADRVDFKGLLSEEDLEREFAEAAVIVLPSYAETSPMFIQQAMAAGKAIIATGVGGLPYLIDDGVTGLLLQPGDVAGLAERLQRLLGDDALRARLGGGAKEQAVARFSTRGVAERTVEVYRDVLGGRPARS